jgi:hypothetical protein
MASSRKNTLGAVATNFIAMLMALALLLAIALALAVIETQPALTQRPPAGAEDARRAKLLYRRIVDWVNSDQQQSQISVTAADLDSLSALANLASGDLRGRAAVEDHAVAAQLSAQIPYLPGGLWLNASAHLLPSSHGLALSDVQVGHLHLPPAVAMALLQQGARFALGKPAADGALGAIQAITISDAEAVLHLDLAADRRRDMAHGLSRLARQVAGLSQPPEIEHYVTVIDQAFSQRTLASTASLGAVVRLVMAEAAGKMRAGGKTDEVQAATLALAAYCGHPRFQDAIGQVLPATDTQCQDVTLGGRIDLRRHFLVSAGLKVLSGPDAAFAAGEMKELLDTAGGGSGFDFTDLTADQAGILFAQRTASLTAQQLDGMMARWTSDADVLPPLAGLPASLSADDFSQRYGDTASPAYQSLVADIRARVQQAPLFQPVN